MARPGPRIDRAAAVTAGRPQGVVVAQAAGHAGQECPGQDVTGTGDLGGGGLRRPDGDGGVAMPEQSDLARPVGDDNRSQAGRVGQGGESGELDGVDEDDPGMRQERSGSADHLPGTGEVEVGAEHQPGAGQAAQHRTNQKGPPAAHVVLAVAADRVEAMAGERFRGAEGAVDAGQLPGAGVGEREGT